MRVNTGYPICMSAISTQSSTRPLRASWVLPISGPPIENGEVVIDGEHIVDVRKAPAVNSSDVTDYGPAIIMPGLVNVHTHLDYTLMRGLLEDIQFFPWIRELTARKAVITWDDWVASATIGAAEAVAGGVTAIGDCTDSGAALYGAKNLGLSGVIYQEVFGIDDSRTVDAILQELHTKVHNHVEAAANTRLEIGISPHAPYTVGPALMAALAKYAEENALRLCIHASESQAEAELIRSGTGPIATMFNRRGIAWQIPGSGAAAYLGTLGVLGSRTLLVHGVQLAAEERKALQQNGVAWAHCPKSNAKLGNGVADLGMLGLEDARLALDGPPRIGLGSDGVASNNNMDLFEEMRFAVLMQRGMRRNISALTAKEAVEMATLGGAKSLGLDAGIGSLEPGKIADLCVVKIADLHATPCYDPYSALVYASHASDVIQTIIGGVTMYDADKERSDECFLEFDIKPAMLRMKAAAQVMREWRSSEQ